MENLLARGCVECSNAEYKWCKTCQINYLKGNIANWNSKNEQIDELIKSIRDMQLKLDNFNNTIFEWIPYYQFYDIIELINKTHLAKWKDGPLSCNYYNEEYARDSNIKVILKYLVGSQNITYEFLNEIIAHYKEVKVYGISQNPDTKYYIIILNGYQYLKNCCIKCGKYNIDTHKILYKWCKYCQISWLKENFTNWTTKENKQIDILIQEMQLKINNTLFVRWIPYCYFDNIEELCNTTYSARWNDYDLIYNFYYIRNSIILYPQNLTYEFLDEIIANYSKVEVYGISQNPDTKYYIIIFNKAQYLKNCCIKCGKYNIDNTHKILHKWCKHCQINWLKENFTNWASENKQIDDLIQEMQLKINDTLFAEWIPYYQFYNINKELYNATYSARWKDDLSSDYYSIENSVILKYLVNPQNLTYEFLDETIAYYKEVKVYGISQDPDTKYYIIIFNKDQYLKNCCMKCGKYNIDTYKIWSRWCKHCQINWLKENFTNWASENKQIDDLIQEMQLEINDTLFAKWIPYYQFYNISKELCNATYSARWEDDLSSGYHNIEDSSVILKYLVNPQDFTYEFLDEIIANYSKVEVYGISQNPDTKYYIIIFNKDQYLKNCCIKCGKYHIDTHKILYKWCKHCQINWLKENFTNWASENKQIDDLIQEMQLKINDTLFAKWIPYYQFYNISKELCNATYSARWEDDLSSGYHNIEDSSVILKYLVNPQNITYGLLDEIIAYYNKVEVYGISQYPDTNYYIIVFNGDQYLENCCVKCEKYYTNAKCKWCKPCQMNWLKENFINWTSENKQINNIIQEVQLKINDYNDTIFEWIPYYQIVDIKDLSNTTYSAKWKDGPLYWNGKTYTRNLENKAVILRYLDNAQNELLDEIISYYYILQIYGISQNSSTKNYIIVLNQEQYFKKICNKCANKYVNTEYKWCEACQKSYLKENFTNWTSDNKQIDRLIQEMQLKINDVKDIIFEWIPYNQFYNIKEIGKGGFAKVYSARWKNGPLYWNRMEYTRDSNKTVALKCLNNSQNISNKFLNEVKAYSINNLNNIDNSGEILKIFGISQNPDTKDYIMVLQHARGGNFNNWLNNNYKNFNWSYKLKVLNNIISSLKKIHRKQLVHRDLHTGNILFKDTYYWVTSNYISDMGSSGKVDNIDETSIYGVMPYVAPEVLRGNPYTEAADVYSFGMVMYFVATEKQPFANRAHDGLLALDICNGVRPEIINEQEAPKCYIDLMKKCLDLNPANRLNVTEVEVTIKLFYEDQFEAAEEYRLNNNDGDKNNQSTTHPQAIYTSRLLNPFTKSLSKYTDDNTDCLDCSI